jgi:hypothetical protein
METVEPELWWALVLYVEFAESAGIAELKNRIL